MNQNSTDAHLNWGKYDVTWLLSEYLKELDSHKPTEGFTKAAGQTKALFLSVQTAVPQKIGGANLQFFHDYVLIDVMWVSPTHRGQGFGRVLLREIERHAKELGLRRVLLSAFEHQNSVEFWKKMGCEEVGRIRDYPAGQQLVYLHKRLL